MEYFKSRPPEVESAIRETWGSPQEIPGFVQANELNELREIYQATNQQQAFQERKEAYTEDLYVTADYHLHRQHDVISRIMDIRLRNVLDHDFDIQYCFFTKMYKPYTVHTDSSIHPDQKIYKVAH